MIYNVYKIVYNVEIGNKTMVTTCCNYLEHPFHKYYVYNVILHDAYTQENKDTDHQPAIIVCDPLQLIAIILTMH